MSSANLLALRNAILSNTLTPEQQAPLANALAAIAPLFPPPDAIASIAPIAAQLADEWFAVLYSINAGGSSGIIPLESGIIYAPNAANLANTEVTGLPQGQLAIVETFGAEFSLQPLGALSVDGVTVIASPDPSLVWERGDTVIAETARAQTAWFVDGSDVSGHADDENSGATAIAPLVHVAEVMRRLGTWSPTYDGATVTVTYLSQNAFDDPSLFAPIFLNSARFIQTGTLPSSPDFTGTLLAVTPKNQAGNSPLKSTFTVATGAVAPRMLLVNTTRGDSRAFAVFDTGGGNFQITQPLAPYPGTGLPMSAEVDTWANGDSIEGFLLTNVNLGIVGGQSVDLNADFGQSHVVQLMHGIDPFGLGALDVLFVDQDAAPLLVDCVQERQISCNATVTVAQAIFLGVDVATLFFSLSNTLNSPVLRGGVYENGVLSTAGGFSLQGDVQLLVTSVIQGANIQDGVFVGAGSAIRLLKGAIQQSAPVYGQGNCESLGQWNFAGLATTAFPCAGGLKINGVTHAYAFATGGGNVVSTFGGIALTAANLDAAAAGPPSPGFGGLASVPGVGCFQKGVSTP